MKKFSILALVAVMLCAMSCNNGGCKVEPKGTSDSLNYYIGAFFGTMIKQQMKQGPDSAKFNEAEFLKGVKAVLSVDTAKSSIADGMGVGLNLYMTARQMKQNEGVELDTKAIFAYLEKALKSDTTVVDPGTAQMMIQQLIQKQKEENLAKSPEAIENAKKGEEFMANITKDPAVKTTASGLAYKVVKEGNGTRFVLGDRINVIYTGKHINDSIFDSSKGEPVPMSPDHVVPGFKEALLLMSPGAEFVVYIPGKLGYGVSGTPNGSIKPNETLVFEISTPDLYKPEEEKK
ncbi:MAG: FKBP-type peptidyl-prolyl cis-trans isomerase N-terminal domain-containing protein [Muribaculaceae bacterium]|nr:FKBP-type peptidyl-prolyl cis-trans isomerase N-terminal domain-containing protein [Muribaculaceae bacterium]MDY3931991.1 FKBP-type peptidyl-prolyl cis-trans isomerase N-terminal domain-containing protein [Muribaculaceae bacterium]